MSKQRHEIREVHVSAGLMEEFLRCCAVLSARWPLLGSLLHSSPVCQQLGALCNVLAAVLGPTMLCP